MTDLFRGRLVKEVKRIHAFECKPAKDVYCVWYEDGSQENVKKYAIWDRTTNKTTYDTEHLFLDAHSDREYQEKGIE